MPQDQPTLPELPIAAYRRLSDLQEGIDSYYTAEQMRSYALAAIAASYPKGAALPEGVWQPLETRPLPPATYLVANDKGQVAPWINGIIHSNPGTERDWNYGESITHWMPLPQPPQESA